MVVLGLRKGWGGFVIVREADENDNSPALQRWVGGNQPGQSPRSGQQTFRWRSSISSLCRPFHGLAILFAICSQC